MPFTIPADSANSEESTVKKTGFTIPAAPEAPPSFFSTLGRRASDAWAGRPDIPPVPKSNAEFLAQVKQAPQGLMRSLGTVGGVIGSPAGAAEEALVYKGAKAAGASEEAARANAKYAGDRLQEIAPALLFPEAQKLKNAPATASKITEDITKGISNKAGDVVVKALPPVDPGLLPVTKLAQKYNIPLSLDEVTGSRALKAVQKVGQDLPFSGQQAFREKQMSAWNKGILDSLGETGTKITPETMDKAYTRLGAEFDKLGKGKTFDMGANFDAKIAEIRNEAMSTTTRDSIANFDNEVANIKKEIDPTTGTISGEKLNTLRAKVNKLARKTDIQGTKELLSDLEDAIVETMTADPEAAKAFSKVKQQYKNFITLEPLVQKGKAGNISPVNLSNRVARVYGRSYTTGNAGEIGELARVGRELLPELGGSDTYVKTMYGLGATGAALSHPAATGVAIGGNRAFQSAINRNQNLIRKAIENSPGQYLNSPLDTPLESVVSKVPNQ